MPHGSDHREVRPAVRGDIAGGGIVSLAGLGQHVQTGEKHGRGAGEGIYGLTSSKFVFRFDDPPPERGRFVAFPLDVIVDAEQKWIVVPGMSELVLQINGPNGVFVSSYYIGTREAKEIATKLGT